MPAARACLERGAQRAGVGARPIGSTGVQTAPRANTRDAVDGSARPSSSGRSRPRPARGTRSGRPTRRSHAVHAQPHVVQRRRAVRVRPPAGDIGHAQLAASRRHRGRRSWRPDGAPSSTTSPAPPRERRGDGQDAVVALHRRPQRQRVDRRARAAARRRTGRHGPAIGGPGREPRRAAEQRGAEQAQRAVGEPRPPAGARPARRLQQRVQRREADRELVAPAAGGPTSRRAPRTSTCSASTSARSSVDLGDRGDAVEAQDELLAVGRRRLEDGRGTTSPGRRRRRGAGRPAPPPARAGRRARHGRVVQSRSSSAPGPAAPGGATPASRQVALVTAPRRRAAHGLVPGRGQVGDHRVADRTPGGARA